EAHSKSALDSLKEDARIEFAYPVYVNASSGKRHFLEDELVVRLNMPLAPAPTNLFSPFKLAVTDTLNAKENIYVCRLTEPKNFDPFKVCDALRQRAEVIWAEPNMAQEIQQSVIQTTLRLPVSGT